MVLDIKVTNNDYLESHDEGNLFLVIIVTDKNNDSKKRIFGKNKSADACLASIIMLNP